MWFNAFAWTFRTREFDKQGVKRDLAPEDRHTPFITWPVQDVAIEEICDSILNKLDAILDKSRDMGASWLCLGSIHYFWQFRFDFMAIETSEKEDTVIDRYTEKGLFFRHQYLLKHQPQWMVPKHKFVNKKLVNLVNGSAISGEATTPNIAMGGRPDVVLLDEFKSVDCGEEVLRATADAAGCRLFNSTPKTGSAYSRLYKEARKPGKKIKIITLGYWDHPEKGPGREWKYDEDGTITGKAGRGFYDTPWLREELSRRTSMAEIASEIFIDHDTSGMMFFDSVTVDRLQQSARPPLHRGEIIEDPESKEIKWVEHPSGKWKLWCPLKHGRPPSETNYVQAWDVSGGVAGSNTVGAVMDRMTGAVIAEYADPNIAPQDAGDLAIAAGKFFDGQCGYAFLGWENNGIGLAFMHQVKKSNYPHVYFKRAYDSRRNKRTKTYGWQSSEKLKVILLYEFNAALMRGEVDIFSEEAISELQDYLTSDTGKIVAATRMDLKSGAYDRHGDRVIAYALAHFLRKEAPRFVKDKPRIKSGSMADVLGHEKVWKSVRNNA